MSLQAILDAIEANSHTQVQEIEAQTHTQASEILADSQQEARLAYERALAETLAPAAETRARIYHQARLEALRTVGDIREELVDRAIDQIRGRLGSIRTDTAYPDVLRRLTETALAALDLPAEEATNIQLQADPKDRHPLDIILQDLHLDLTVVYKLDCWGGVVASSPDGRIVVINTLESRLARAMPYLRRYLAALFEGGSPQTADRPIRVPEGA